jgi:hypothetical protein
MLSREPYIYATPRSLVITTLTLRAENSLPRDLTVRVYRVLNMNFGEFPYQELL